MNIDPKFFTAERKKALKAALKSKKLSDKVQQLISLHTNRINDGVDRGLRNARAYYAIDRAYDVSQHQISPTLVRDLIDRNPNSQEVQSLVHSWGLDSMMTRVDDVSKAGLPVKGADGKPGYLLQSPTFFTIFIPLLLSYVKIRWAKLFNDRDLHPLYKYEPLVLNTKDRAVAKIVTARVQRMAAEMNCRAVERDSIQKMLLYGECINFPQEPWFTEKQKIGNKETIVKEGVRYAIPHPVRTFKDTTHPAYTINSDTGCKWYGYWTMFNYGDIVNNKDYWIDRDKKGMPNEMIISQGWRGNELYSNVYSMFYPCTVKFPAVQTAKISGNDRTHSAYYQYKSDTLDAGIDVSVFFHKLNPKEWDLYDYDYEVWHRFIYAGNDTILYCEPVFYPPAVAYLYDYDGERARNSSLGFELLPFQDQFGNLLSQQLLTVKKNLIRIVAVDEDLVPKDFRDKMVNFAENSLRGLEMMPFSGQAMKDQQSEIGKAFWPIPLQQMPTAEIIGAMNSLISVLERLLGYSSQEVGASASHQQSAQEVNLIAGSSSTRMNFTGGFVDDAIYARKKQLYYAMMHYSADEIFVEVSDVTPDGKKALESMGFKLTVNDNEPGVMTVRGSKKNLVFESVLSERDGSNRTQDNQVAVMLTTFLDRLMANPRIGEQIPLKFVFKFFNQISDYLGLPSELKLPEDLDEKNAEAQQAQLQQMQQAVSQMITQQVGPPLQKLAQQVAGNAQQTEQAITAVAQQQQQIGQAVQQIATTQQNDEQALQIMMQKFDQLIQAASIPPGQPQMSLVG